MASNNLCLLLVPYPRPPRFSDLPTLLRSSPKRVTNHNRKQGSRQARVLVFFSLFSLPRSSWDQNISKIELWPNWSKKSLKMKYSFCLHFTYINYQGFQTIKKQNQYARHYNPRFLYFLPTLKTISLFSGGFLGKFCSYVLVDIYFLRNKLYGS